MARRRAILVALGSVGVPGLAVGTTGCLGSGVSERAEQSYENARDGLLENAETLDEMARGHVERDRSRIDAVRSNVEDARVALDEAATADEAGALSDEIDHARSVAAFQESIAEFHDLVLEFEAARTDATAFADSEQHVQAVEEYETALDGLDQIRSHLDDLESTHERIDHDAADDPDLDYSGEYAEYVDLEGVAEIDAHELLVEGQLHLNQLLVDLETAFDELDDEAFDAARDAFDAAESARADAVAAFDAVQQHDGAPGNLRQEAIALHGIVVDLEDAFELFHQATDELEAGNGAEGTALVEEGWSIVDSTFE